MQALPIILLLSLGQYGPWVGIGINPPTGSPSTYSGALDSVNGDDANDCRKQSNPCRTIAGLQAKPWYSKVKKVWLARGSIFREQFALPANAYVGAYGTGEKPIISGADVLAADLFTLTVGQTYTYQIAIPSIPTTTNPYANLTNADVLMVWENNVRLGGLLQNNCTSIACVESTAGRFWWDSTNKILYVHPADNSDPATNGKTYEVSTRTLAIHGGDNVVVEDLIAEKAYAKTGTGQQGYEILGYRAGTYRRCIARQCWNHCAGSNNSEPGDLLFDHVWAHDAENIQPTSAPASLFVAHKASISPSPVVTFDHCLATQPSLHATDQVAGYLAHGDSVTAILKDSAAEHMYYGAQVEPGVGHLTQTGTYTAKHCYFGIQANATVALSNITTSGCTYGVAFQGQGSTLSNGKILDSVTGVDGTFSSGVAFTVQDSVIANAAAPGSAEAQKGLVTTKALGITGQRNVYYQCGAAMQGETAASDYNNFFGNIRVSAWGQWGLVASLAAWKTASSMDAHSTATDPGYTADFFVVTLSDPTQ